MLLNKKGLRTRNGLMIATTRHPFRGRRIQERLTERGLSDELIFFTATTDSVSSCIEKDILLMLILRATGMAESLVVAVT